MNSKISLLLSFTFFIGSVLSSTFHVLIESKFPGIFNEVSFCVENYPSICKNFERTSLIEDILVLDSGRHGFTVSRLFMETFTSDYEKDPVSKEIIDKYLTMSPSRDAIFKIAIICAFANIESLFDKILDDFGVLFQDSLNMLEDTSSLLMLADVKVTSTPKCLKYLEKLYRKGFHFKFLKLSLFMALIDLKEDNIEENISALNYFVSETDTLDINLPFDSDTNESNLKLYLVHSFLLGNSSLELKKRMLETFIQLGADLNVRDPLNRTAHEIASELGILY